MTFRPYHIRASVRWVGPLFVCGLFLGLIFSPQRVWCQTAQPAVTPSTAPAAGETPTPVDGTTLSVNGDATVPVIPLQVEGCRVDEMNEVRRLLKIELEAEVIGGEAAAPQADPSAVGVRVKVICRGAEYRIFIIDADPERTRTRELDLSSTGSRARPRFVALSIVEAMTTLPKPAEPAPPSPTPVPVAPAVIAVAPPVVENPAPASTEALVQAVGRYFPSTSRANGGIGVMLSHALRASLSLDVDLTGEGGRQILNEGDLNILAASIGAGGSYVRREKEFSFRVGGGVRLGVAQITGVAADPSSTTEDAFAGPWGGPFLSAGVGTRVGENIVVRIGAEAGHALLQTTGRVRIQNPDGSTGVTGRGGVEGPWLALFASAGWQP